MKQAKRKLVQGPMPLPQQSRVRRWVASFSAHRSGAVCSTLHASVMSSAGRWKAASSTVPLRCRSFLHHRAPKPTHRHTAVGGTAARRCVCFRLFDCQLLPGPSPSQPSLPESYKLIAERSQSSPNTTLLSTHLLLPHTYGCSLQHTRSPRRPCVYATQPRQAGGPLQTGSAQSRRPCPCRHQATRGRGQAGDTSVGKLVQLCSWAAKLA